MTDRHALINETIAALEQRHVHPNVAKVAAELLTEMAGSDRHTVHSNARVLLAHLIKWAYQPALRSRSWDDTISEHRMRIMDAIDDMPSLRPYLEGNWQSWWTRSRASAIKQMRANPFNPVPDACPWTLDQIMDEDWLPE